MCEVSESSLPLSDVVGGEGGGVVGGQRDEVVEHPRPGARLVLEPPDVVVRQLRERRVVIRGGHQLIPRVGRHVLARRGHGVVSLLAEVQRPVEGGAVVIHQLRVGNLNPSSIDN